MTTERSARVLSGWLMLPVTIAAFAIGTWLTVIAFTEGTRSAAGDLVPSWWLLVLGLVVLTLASISCAGFFTLQPNQARVLVLFGHYHGTTRQGGFSWGNPFYSNSPAGRPQEKAPINWTTGKREATSGQPERGGEKRFKISLRARTLNGEKLKVNDLRGNPVEIAAVVVWRVENTAKAVFDVEDYEQYVATQSETAVRHLATKYPYDSGETLADAVEETTLRGNVDEVSAALRDELADRLAPAGVVVEQARLTHLAYSPEIAQAMLRRQQAQAVIAARRMIVTGAVSMVEMALKDLADKHVVDLDEERKAAMISNLMVVLCGESQVSPVVNAGSLYQ